MKGRQVVLDHIKGRDVAALLVDGRLDDLLIAPRDDAPPAPGAIFRGVTDRPLKGQGGIIITLPDGQNALFRQAKGLAPGQPILVQVTSYTEAGKAVPVTDRLIFKGRRVIVTPGAQGLNISRRIRDDDERERLLEALHRSRAPQSGHGVIVRSDALDDDADDIAQEADSLLDLADQVLGDTSTTPELLIDAPGPHDLSWRDWGKAETVEGFETHGVSDLLAALDTPAIKLAQGHAYIEPTRALVAVDVNTGGDFSPAAGLKANLALADILPRALRLRGLGGQIVIDAAPMPKKDRKQFESRLRSAFKACPIETSLVGWTPLGHFELQRKRERLPLEKGFFT